MPKIKLTQKQKEIVKLMRGASPEIFSSLQKQPYEHRTYSLEGKRVSGATVKILLGLEILKYGRLGKVWHVEYLELTDLGRTINLD